jgi:hypothetical protein
LENLRDDLTHRMREDNSGWERVLRLPDSPAETLATPRDADGIAAD